LIDTLVICYIYYSGFVEECKAFIQLSRCFVVCW